MSTTDEEQHQGFRSRLQARPGLLLAYRIGVGVVGGLVVALGIIAIPYPGPGWLIVFAGLAILATEFHWAKRVLTFARGRYDAWTAWLGRQNLLVKLAVLTLTAAVVLASLYLLNALYLVAGWIGLDGWTWLQSPFFG
ncbi:TIGR02611 family protein [Pseudonocardia sp. GCM10023141]|uniref:TIGR02611 family protein n=1 Tax=Pseudonocardia sp. GCM10023141 TaxID=3252653 RepID=UPI0036233771